MDDSTENLTAQGGSPISATPVAPKANKAPAKPKRLSVAFFEDGTAQHTLRDDFFRLFPDKPREIQRMTTIEHDPVHQKFYIMFLRGTWEMSPRRAIKLAGVVYCYEVAEAFVRGSFGEITAVLATRARFPGKKILFDTYEEAVRTELILVDNLRTLGFKF